MSDLIPTKNIISGLEMYEPYPPPDEFVYPFGPRKHLREYVQTLLCRKWMILTCVLFFVAAAAVITFHQTPIYEATAKVEIDLQTTSNLPYKDFSQDGYNLYLYQEYLATQIGHITSRSLARQVVLAAGLDLEIPAGVEPDNKPFQLNSLWSWIPGLEESEEEEVHQLTREEKIEQEIDIILSHLDVVPERDSRLAEIKYRSPDPEQAANIVNILTREYITYNFESRFDDTERATEFLQNQLVNLKAKLEDSDEALIEYARENNILSLGENQDVILQTLGEINSNLTAARALRMEKESIYRTMAGAATDKFPQALRTPLMEQLEPKLLADEQALAQMTMQLGPAMPQVKQLEGRVRQAREQLESEKQLAIENAKTEYETALEQERLLSEAFDEQKVLANKVSESSLQYNILRREVETNRQLYDGLLQRIKEAGVAAGLESSNIRIVDAARVPESPSSPKPVRNLILALMLGMMGGVGLAFLLDYMDNTIKTPEDVEEKVGLPSLGLIPSLKSARGRYGRLPSPRKQSNAPVEALVRQGVELASLNAGSSQIGEAYRGLRTALLLSKPGNPPRIIMVTSSKAEEGKTTTVCNTALSLAQDGKKVLVMECDMRCPRIGEIFQANGSGLSEYLTGQVEFDDIIKEVTIPNLFIAHAGTLPPNPAELLDSQRMHDGILAAAEKFDFILIDTPPLMAVADPLIIAPLADGVILVLKGGGISPDILKKSKKSLEMVHARILGVVCNNVDLNSGSYHYYYAQYQGYNSTSS
jgi:succinoglycan biosynthesis transport protein ExoP